MPPPTGEMSAAKPRPEAPAPALEPIAPLPLPLRPRSQPERPRVSVIVPVFNEEDVIERFYEALRDEMGSRGIDWRVLFVNDGSTDGTLRILDRLHESDRHLDYVALSRNFGHQAALAAGLRHADGDVVVTMDGDLQHPPALIPAMLEAWRQGFDVVHTRKVATVRIALWRAWLTRIAYAIIARAADVPILAQASDFRAVDRQVLSELTALPEVSPLFRGLTPWLGYRQCVIPFVAEDRAGGRSQYSLRQLVGLFTRAMFDFSNASLYLGLLIGMTALALSSLYFVFIIGWWATGRPTPTGWTSSVSVSLLLNSITLTFLGIVAVYVARIYAEVRRRPPYVVGRVRRHAPPDAGK